MNPGETIRVLLVEDDEDDYILARELFSEIPGQRFVLDWVKTFDTGLENLSRNQHDVALLDYRLGAQNGVELLRAAIERGCSAPVILLTGSGQHQVDLEAMQAGAADYLVKADLHAKSLERSIRYAIQRKRAAAVAAFEQARLAAFGAEVGLALTRRDSLEVILDRCAKAMAQFLNAALAQIATFDPRKGCFDTRAAAGQIIRPNQPAHPWPEVCLDLDSLSQGKPLVIKQLAHDERIVDQGWIKKEGLASYAAYPLVLEDKLVGLMSIFSQQPLSDAISQEMGSVANGISLCIERKRSEEALDASEVKYRSVVENIKEVIFQMDEFGHWTFLNPAWTVVTGFEVKPTLGSFFVEYLHEEDREHNRHIFLQLIEGKVDYCRYETRFLTKNGTVRWVEVYAQRTFNPDGTVLGLSGSLTDITEHKQAEKAIQKLAAFPQVNPNPIFEFAADGSVTYSNDAAHDMARSLGKENLLEILPPSAAGIACECLASGEKRLREEVCLAGRTITWSFFPVVANHVVHCYGTDITDVLNLEAQFRHAQKLESVGQLAAGVAHDFNNVLTVIQGYTESLLSRCQADPHSATALKQISDAAKRAATLTRQLLLFSRKQVLQTRVLDLNAVLQNLANMLLRLLGEDITLDAKYAPNLPRVEADAGMLEQIVMNLAVNSRDAMPKGGKLLIGTSTVEIDETYAAQHPDARAGQFVCLLVQDTGLGMDRKTLDRIFEPFFSTKEVGKGTGLGLATVYGIVKQHLGWIEVASRVEAGTTFKIYFPITSRTDEAPAELSVPAEPIRGGKETILVVEDEPVLRELVCEVLQQYDYQVIQAASGVEALRIWDEFNGEIQLLLTDMVMPEGMTGKELAAQLKKRKPDLKVIYSSGYSPEIMGRDFGQSDTVFLSKPYVPPQLARAVRQCLDGRKQQGTPIARG
ncbi:MAG TPA: response regulator [Verrucomicrobiae bacterium]|nr:response regulator [Verrucomicrobiae bacterium]